MKQRALRIAAVISADFRIRFRRLSTVVIFLLLSFTPYLWIPAPSTGRALIQINGQRVLYNSAAIGLATATIAAVFIQLIGFYVVSNAIRRDVESRCGFVIASTTMRSGEYLVGKFFGNLTFLATFIAGFMATSMAMLAARGESPLEPWVFVRHYLLIVPPAIVFVSVLAIVFESVPLLSGKFGDALYFFLLVGSLGIVAGITDNGGSGMAGYFDYSGLAFLRHALKATLHASSMSIGSSPFDATKPVLTFPGLILNGWGLARLGSLVTPLPLLLVARLFFHRFDPARVRRAAGKGQRNWLRRLNALLKPVARILAAGGRERVAPPTLLSSARVDAAVSLEAFPLSILAMAGFAFASLIAPAASFFTGLLPILFAVFAIFIADIACRERRAGTLGFIDSSPLLQRDFVAWKLLSVSIVALAFLIVPIVRTAIARPQSVVPLIVGGLFVVALSTALGVVSGNPKTFIVVFLSFWYLVNDDKGKTPSLDFAGFFGTATPAVTLTYLAFSAAALIVAQAVYSARLKRELG